MEKMRLNMKALEQIVDFEGLLVLSFLFLGTWIFYRYLLKSVSQERHNNIQNHLRNILKHYITLLGLFAILLATETFLDANSRILPYIALLTYFWGLVVFVKISRLLTLMYLFLGSMRAGVPLLIVNIISLLLSCFLGIWTLNHLFDIQVAPLLATSAALSIVLGLALQDTLGNLFAGISLQLDKNFDIGDWLEIKGPQGVTVGQVAEISWRATTLTGWTDETITLPNRIISSSQISNYSIQNQPIYRTQTFKVKYTVDIAMVKKLCLEALSELPQIRQEPKPVVLASEAGENSLAIRIAYAIDNFGSQYSIADQVISKVLTTFHQNQIEIAPPRFELLK